MRSRMTRCLGMAVLALGAGFSGVAGQKAPARLDSIFARYAGPATAGCALAATSPGMKLEKAYGMADLERSVANTPATIFEAGSVSKQFTAAALVLLAQRGKLSLDDDVRKYLPEVPSFEGRTITLRQLLQHTSGLRDWGVVAGLQGWPRGTRAYTNDIVLDIVAHQRKLNYPPGAEWMYSNTNYNLAALVVKRVTGLELAEFTRQELFRPLGMTHTSWRDDYTRVVPGRALAYDGRAALSTAMPNENAYGNGGLLTTVADLLLWNQELDAGKVLGRAGLDELQREGVLTSGKSTGYADGLFLGSWRGQREVSHTGATGGYRSVLARYPERGISIAILCNHGGADTGALGHAVADLLLGDVASKATPATAAPRPPRFAIERADLEQLAGTYRDRGSMMPVRIEAGEGVLRSRGQVLEPVSETEFRGPDGILVVFQPAPWGGRARALAITGRDTTVLEAVAPADTAVARLAEYAGRWYSPEADASWTLAVEGGALVARLGAVQRLELRPVYADAFSAGGIWVFDRDAAGRVSGLGLWAPRARDMRMERVK